MPCPALPCRAFVLSVALCAAIQAEGVTELTQKGFIDWCRNGSGYERKHLYDDKKLNEAVQVRTRAVCTRGAGVLSVFLHVSP